MCNSAEVTFSRSRDGGPRWKGCGWAQSVRRARTADPACFGVLLCVERAEARWGSLASRRQPRPRWWLWRFGFGVSWRAQQWGRCRLDAPECRETRCRSGNWQEGVRWKSAWEVRSGVASWCSLTSIRSVGISRTSVTSWTTCCAETGPSRSQLAVVNKPFLMFSRKSVPSSPSASTLLNILGLKSWPVMVACKLCESRASSASRVVWSKRNRTEVPDSEKRCDMAWMRAATRLALINVT